MNPRSHSRWDTVSRRGQPATPLRRLRPARRRPPSQRRRSPRRHSLADTPLARYPTPLPWCLLTKLPRLLPLHSSTPHSTAVHSLHPRTTGPPGRSPDFWALHNVVQGHCVFPASHRPPLPAQCWLFPSRGAPAPPWEAGIPLLGTGRSVIVVEVGRGLGTGWPGSFPLDGTALCPINSLDKSIAGNVL